MILEDENIEAEYLWFVARILSEFNDLKVIISFTQLLQTTEEEEVLNIVAEGLTKMGFSAVKSLEILLPTFRTSKCSMKKLQSLSILRSQLGQNIEYFYSKL